MPTEPTDSTGENIIPIDERLLPRLAPEMAAARLLELPVHRRIEALLARDDAPAVTAALPEQDFYLFLRELGEYDAGLLLAMATPEQFTHLLDLEGWQGDEIQGGRALTWCARMAETNPAALIAWLRQADSELLFLLFRRWIEVLDSPHDEEDETEAMDRLPTATIDGQSFFRSRYPAHEATIRLILQSLFEEDRALYHGLMFNLRQGLEAETAELAYRFHRGRLEDRAIPVPEEARTIYRPLQPGQARVKKSVPSAIDFRVPAFTLALASREGLFASALAGLHDQAARDGIRVELTALVNKLVVADGLAVEEPESLRLAVNKATALICLGLDGVSKGKVAPATAALQRLYLEDLFRLGHTGIAMQAARLAALLRQGWMRDWPHGLGIVDADWEERASLLTGPQPMIIRNQDEGQEGEADYPRTMADLEAIHQFVAMLEGLAPLYKALRADWPMGWDELGTLLWPSGQIATVNAVTLGSLWFTAAARCRWEGGWRALPLPVAAWPEIVCHLAPEAMWQTMESKIRELQPDADGAKRIFDYLRPLIRRYTAEMNALAPDQIPDPRFVPFLLFSPFAGDL